MPTDDMSKPLSDKQKNTIKGSKHFHNGTPTTQDLKEIGIGGFMFWQGKNGLVFSYRTESKLHHKELSLQKDLQFAIDHRNKYTNQQSPAHKRRKYNSALTHEQDADKNNLIEQHKYFHKDAKQAKGYLRDNQFILVKNSENDQYVISCKIGQRIVDEVVTSQNFENKINDYIESGLDGKSNEANIYESISSALGEKSTYDAVTVPEPSVASPLLLSNHAKTATGTNKITKSEYVSVQIRNGSDYDKVNLQQNSENNDNSRSSEYKTPDSLSDKADTPSKQQTKLKT